MKCGLINLMMMKIIKNIFTKKENEKHFSKNKEINDGNNNKILTYNKIDLSTSTMEYILQKIPEHIRPNIDEYLTIYHKLEDDGI